MPKKDQYAQKAFASVTESGANTLTFSELPLAAELQKKTALVVHRILYQPSAASVALLIGAGDIFKFGWSLSSAITDTGLDIAEIFDRRLLGYNNGAQLAPNPYPIDIDFSNLPGGGLIVPVKKMYLFAQGTSLASAGNVESMLYYTVKELSDADYIELVEGLNILT